MVEGSAIEGGGTARKSAIGGLSSVLRTGETWRTSVRYLLFSAATFVALSLLAAALPALLGACTVIIDGGSMRPTRPAGALLTSRRVDPATV